MRKWHPLRLPETLMDNARTMAKAHGVSINQFLATVIAERVGELKALSHVRSRIARADPAQARAVLALVPTRAQPNAESGHEQRRFQSAFNLPNIANSAILVDTLRPVR